MDWNFRKMQDFFNSSGRYHLLMDGKWGLEKESQRITGTGDLALTRHPAAFGSKTQNPYITTDFSESQMELITPPFPTIEETYSFLSGLQTAAESGVGEELLWPLSMPPRLPDEAEIPIARYHDESGAEEREAYRRGLALRYGKKMQMISGLHYNFSFGMGLLDALHQSFGAELERQDFINRLYFAVARNFLRTRWLLIYLFGASPTSDPTYHPVICKEINTIAKCCPEYCGIIEDYRKYATSLRVSRFGYANHDRGRHGAFFNDLGTYLQGIRKLMLTRSKRFHKLGIYRHSSRIQLNDRVLQKESEFYAPIRFKQNPQNGESQLEALEKRGVRYLEVRILDLNPFERNGISLQQLRFMQIFMLYCLFESSPAITAKEFEEMNKNHHAVALFGRTENLKLKHCQKGATPFQEWSGEIFEKLYLIAKLMDEGSQIPHYLTALSEEFKKLDDRSLLLASRMVKEAEAARENFLDFGLRLAMNHKSNGRKEKVNVV